MKRIPLLCACSLIFAAACTEASIEPGDDDSADQGKIASHSQALVACQDAHAAAIASIGDDVLKLGAANARFLGCLAAANYAAVSVIEQTDPVDLQGFAVSVIADHTQRGTDICAMFVDASDIADRSEPWAQIVGCMADRELALGVLIDRWVDFGPGSERLDRDATGDHVASCIAAFEAAASPGETPEQLTERIDALDDCAESKANALKTALGERIVENFPNKKLSEETAGASLAIGKALGGSRVMCQLLNGGLDDPFDDIAPNPDSRLCFADAASLLIDQLLPATE